MVHGVRRELAGHQSHVVRQVRQPVFGQVDTDEPARFRSADRFVLEGGLVRPSRMVMHGCPIASSENSSRDQGSRGFWAMHRQVFRPYSLRREPWAEADVTGPWPGRLRTARGRDGSVGRMLRAQNTEP